MPTVLADRVAEITATTGTGTISLGGVPDIRYVTFNSRIGAGNQTYYAIVSRTLNEWEVGVGTVGTAPATLTRNSVLINHLGTTALVSFSAGVKDVFVDLPAEKVVAQDPMLPQVTLGTSAAPLVRTEADAVFGQVGALVINQTYIPVAGSINHMGVLSVSAIVDGSYGGAAPNWTVGQQIAGRFYSKTASTRTADTQRLVGVSGTATHSAASPYVASFVHAYDAYASALGGPVTNLTCYDTNQSIGGSVVGTARLHWLTPASYFNGGTSGACVGIEIDPWPGGYSNASVTPWTVGAWGNAYAIRAAAGHISMIGPVSFGTSDLPPAQQLAQFISSTATVTPLVQITWTQTQADPIAATPNISAALNACVSFIPTTGAANNMTSVFGEIIGDGTASILGQLIGVYGDAETVAGTTRTGTLLRLLGGKFSGIKRDSGAGLATFVEGVFATASALNGGSVTNLTAYNLSGSVSGTAAVSVWRGIWVATPSIASSATVGTSVGVEVGDYSSLGTQGGTAYAIRVAGGLSQLVDVQVTGKLGLFNATPVVRPTVTGSRASGAALVSLLAALGAGALNAVLDQSTA